MCLLHQSAGEACLLFIHIAAFSTYAPIAYLPSIAYLSLPPPFLFTPPSILNSFTRLPTIRPPMYLPTVYSLFHLSLIRYPGRSKGEGQVRPSLWEVRVGLEAASHMHSQKQGINVYNLCLALSISTYRVQDSLPRKWCHPQWTGLLTSVHVIKTGLSP